MKRGNIELLAYTPNPEIVVAQAASLCYSKEGLKREIDLDSARKLIRRIPQKHGSMLEHISYTFFIEGISRACSHELVRHRHASFSQRSQRYVNEQEAEMILPEKVLAYLRKSPKELSDSFLELYKKTLRIYEDHGISGQEANQDARYFLPNAAETKLIMSMNARSIQNFLNQRMCYRAQDEIRNLAYKMFELVYPTAPSIFENSGPDCISIGCQEGKMSCGKSKEVKEKIGRIKND